MSALAVVVIFAGSSLWLTLLVVLSHFSVIVRGSARAPQYAAAKYGLLGVTKSYAHAFAPTASPRRPFASISLATAMLPPSANAAPRQSTTSAFFPVSSEPILSSRPRGSVTWWRTFSMSTVVLTVPGSSPISPAPRVITTRTFTPALIISRHSSAAL